MPAFLHHARGRILIIRWLEPNTEAALGQLRALIERTHAQVREPLVLAAIIPDTAEVPSAEQRKRFALMFDEIDPCIEAMPMLLLGRSLRQSIVRSVVVAMMLVSKHKGAKISMASSPLQLATVVRELSGLDSRVLLDELRATGLLQANEL